MADASQKESQIAIASTATVQTRILLVRGCQVMLDQDLAELYGVETGALTRAVRRNAERFPSDFMFRLTREEWGDLKCQIGISRDQHGGRRHSPFAFTEHGVAMLSSVLRSKRAVAVNIEIMRAFVERRRLASSYGELEKRIDELERSTAGKLDKHEMQLIAIFKALRQLMAPPSKPKHPVGFQSADGLVARRAKG